MSIETSRKNSGNEKFFVKLENTFIIQLNNYILLQ